MAINIDTRTTVFGDRVVVTGTYAATDVTIDLTGLMASIDACTLTGTAAPPGVLHAGTPAITLNIADVAQISGTTVIIHGGDDAIAGADFAGKFMAIGKRS
tara:strand:+ start:285 stop:587 length:303 start_codon:yes stop_codon:yes gene_type:complete